MKKTLLLAAMSALFAGASFAATTASTAPAAAAAPATTTTATAPAAATTTTTAAPAAKAAVTAVCKDGSAYSGDTMRGACSGHGGVNKSASRQAAAGTDKPAAKAASNAPLATQAAGGGAGMVWANENTKVYHCEGDRFYGKTKHGEYMSASDAKAKGFHADAKNKACAAK